MSRLLKKSRCKTHPGNNPVGIPPGDVQASVALELVGVGTGKIRGIDEVEVSSGSVFSLRSLWTCQRTTDCMSVEVT